MDYQSTSTGLQQAHPTWARSSIGFALRGYGKDEDEFVRRMVLLSNPCVKCGEEMGEHELSVRPLICPGGEVPGWEQKIQVDLGHRHPGSVAATQEEYEGRPPRELR